MEDHKDHEDHSESPGARQSSPQGLTLRERKKRQTRQRISDAATELFCARGFDHVTVAEVAEAAQVSAMTVFNYFPRKEDLFLDRIPEAVELVGRAVREREPEHSPTEAVRRTLLELHDQRHPLAGVADRFVNFWQVVIDSPALQARAREGVEEVEDALARAIAEECGAGPGDEGPRLAAALTVAAYRTAYLTAVRRLLAGERAEDFADEQRALIHRVFDAVERALGQ
ncbi:TetR/AcrR family transcriptional regulator [Streptomyces sp. NPDC001262]|uniref:TetR/AcrR family transcriptional regulator n=1 Tax=unclassified Streptomyces TaxID=2593676 RepID=UPI0036D1FF19